MNRNYGGKRPGAGRPLGSVIVRHVRDLAREQTEIAIKTLVEICQNARVEPRARVVAANALLDRGWGKPREEIVWQHYRGVIPDFPVGEVVAATDWLPSPTENTD
jgi:hypothetical protein